MEIIRTSTNIITASIQTALEAKASGAKVLFIALLEPSIEQIDLLGRYGICVIKDLESFTLDIEKKSCGVTFEKALVPMVARAVNSILNAI
jgi:hypothetical protein